MFEYGRQTMHASNVRMSVVAATKTSTGTHGMSLAYWKRTYREWVRIGKYRLNIDARLLVY
jgi:hypothetical protein